MERFLSTLQRLTDDVENGSAAHQQKLIDLIQHLSSDNNWELCATFIITELEKCTTLHQLAEFQSSPSLFVCCRAIETYLKTSPAERAVTQAEVQKMSNFVNKWLNVFVSRLSGEFQSNILKRKVAQCVCLAITRYYPSNWPSVFDDILGLFSELNIQQLSSPISKSSPMLATFVDVFLEILNELDSFIFNRDIQLTPDEVLRATQIKDSMRETCLPTIIVTLTHILKNLDINTSTDMELICFLLQTVGLYISWMDIKLVVNEQFFPILRSLVQCSNLNLLRSICLLFKGLVCKGMAAFPDKMSLIVGIWNESLQSMVTVPCLAKVLSCDPMISGSITSNSDEDDDDVVNFLQEFSSLFGSIGYNLTEAYRALMSSNRGDVSNSIDTSIFIEENSEVNSVIDQCLERLEAAADISICLLAYPDSDVSQGVLMFIGDYLGLLRGQTEQLSVTSANKVPLKNTRVATNGQTALPVSKNKIQLELTPERLYKLERLLRVLVDKIKYPVDVSAEEMEEFEEDRHEFLSVVRSVARIDGSLVLNAIQSLLQQALLQLPAKDDATLARLEACLYLFFSAGEFYKASRNDHFVDSYLHSEKMTQLMATICCSSVSSIVSAYPIQLDFFEIIGRYDKFFNTSPKLIFEVLAAFLDERGLRNPNIKVRCRCAYLFSRLVKSHKNLLAPHAEQILQQLEQLLSLDPAPEPPKINEHNGMAKPFVNGASGSCDTSPQKFLTITEQSFLYESSAHLILARANSTAVHMTSSGVAENGSNPSAATTQASQLLAMLLGPILHQFPDLVRLLAAEKEPVLAEARGAIVKQAADLITRVTRVMSGQSMPNPCFVQLFMEILNVMVGALAYLPQPSGAPGRAAACAGIRAFLQRLIGSIGPDCGVTFQPPKIVGEEQVRQTATTASDWLLLAISTAVPQLIDMHRDPYTDISYGDPDIRWRELKEHMPLFTQVTSRYKERSLPFLTACLPRLVMATLNALSEPLDEVQLVAMDERKLLRRALLQLLYSISQVLPQGVLLALGSEAANVLVSMVTLTEACLESDDPVGAKSGFAFFSSLVVAVFGSGSEDQWFYEEFILTRLLPLCFLSPARPQFRLTDAQYLLALNEATNCLHCVNIAKGQVFQDFLQKTFLPQQHLSAEYVDLYINSLRTNNLAGFQVLVKDFYSSFR